MQSDRAVAINIEIMRAFVRLRNMILSNKDLARKLDALERRIETHDRGIRSRVGRRLWYWACLV